MTNSKLIRQSMSNVGPLPPNTTQERITDRALIHALLVAKLHEEAQEVATAKTRDELLGELGDVYEVWHSLCLMHGFTPRDVLNAAWQKAELRGNLLSSSLDGTVSAILQRADTL